MREAGVATLTIRRSEARNALSETALQALCECVTSLAGDPEVRVLVLCGEGRVFCAGGDVAFFADLIERPVEARHAALSRYIGLAHALILALARLPQPVIVAAQGAAAGFGLSLLCVADLAIAASGTRLVPAYGNLGTSPDGGLSLRLPALIGERRARGLLLEGADFDAEQGEAWGLINQVVPGEELADAAQALARRVASGAGSAQRHVKRLVSRPWAEALAAHLDAELEAFRDCAAHPDFAEGVGAFIARRTPRFPAS